MALRGIGSKATQGLVAALSSAFAGSLAFESVGGVDAVLRLENGEVFDLVVLAEEAIAKQLRAGRLVGEPRVIGVSEVAIAVPAGAARVDIGSAASLRQALLGAARIGFSTGPSGVALVRLIERWGLAESLQGRLVQSRPGVPVAAMLAAGQADLGFQQLSELRGQPGIELLGVMPPGEEIVTRFVGAVGAGSTQRAAAHEALEFMAAPAQDAIRQAQGMAIAGT
ncbi:substrate-binding domain-containing protein [Paucibacter sp. R3-3]|uniref:Substrate-binding domain-containing protein n=1 Tax=Roseateles agri TaxID=3098619 RepID=A0ABU5DT14_9BURK|nr:substrate-binding domain-containing protein [Paucibacter sp. R3-3]MDY0748981.1 substrate-binding domain-containing protein [Paucibacter sp. R3-3]